MLISSIIYSRFMHFFRTRKQEFDPPTNNEETTNKNKENPVKPVFKGFFKYRSGLKGYKYQDDDLVKGLYPEEELTLLEEEEDDLETVDDLIEKIIDNLYQFAKTAANKRSKMKIISKIMYRRTI